MHSILAHRLPRIRSYEAAKEFYEQTAPIKGRSTDIRPLLTSRKDHMTIHIKQPEGQTAYALRLYNTDVVTFHADGRVVVDVRYTSVSTAAFASAFALVPFSMVGRHIVARTPSGVMVKQSGIYTFVGGKLESYSPLKVVRLGPTAAKARSLVARILKRCEEMAAVLLPVMTPESYQALSQAPRAGTTAPIQPMWFPPGEELDPERWAELLCPHIVKYYSGYYVDMVRLKQDVHQAAYRANAAYIDVPLPPGELRRGWRFVGGEDMPCSE